MDKFKSMLNVSERDKQLLMVVLAIAIVALAYFIGYQNLTETANKLDTEKQELQKTQKELKEKDKNKDKYISDTKLFNKEFEDVLKQYSNGSTQPTSIDFLNKVEATSGAWIRSVTFAQPVPVYSFGQKASSNPSQSSGLAYSSDMVGYQTTLSMSYEAEYKAWKDLVKYINEYSSKNTIDTISMSYNDATGTVMGTITVSLYSISGADRKFAEPKFDLPLGTTNIFSTGVAPTRP